ncbi:MAG: hypothetical protein R3B70_46985 [Polyangiaceae bacterium]
MASNFHNILGFLAVGVDVHKGPIAPVLVPGPCAELVAVHPFVLGPNQKPSVKINGVNSVVDLHTSFVSWPHAPVTPPNILWPLDLVFGTHSCWLPRGAVHIEGTPSTCAIIECVSVDLDCWEWAPIPSDLTLQFGTVQTTPTAQDFLFGAVRAIVSGAISAGLNLGFARLGKVKIGNTPLSKFTSGWTDRLGNALTKRGLGYKFARALGKPMMSSFLQGASRQKISGASWAAGRRIVNAAIGKVLPGSASSATSTGLGMFGFDPGTVIAQQVAGPLPGTEPASLFKGFNPASTALKKVPLYNAVQGGIQAVGGP